MGSMCLPKCVIWSVTTLWDSTCGRWLGPEDAAPVMGSVPLPQDAGGNLLPLSWPREDGGSRLSADQETALTRLPASKLWETSVCCFSNMVFFYSSLNWPGHLGSIMASVTRFSKFSCFAVFCQIILGWFIGVEIPHLAPLTTRVVKGTLLNR